MLLTFKDYISYFHKLYYLFLVIVLITFHYYITYFK